MKKELLKNIKKSIVFIGNIQQDNNKLFENIQGTGALIQINNVYYLLTAKHVVANTNIETGEITEKKGLSAFLNLKSKKGVKLVQFDELKKEG